MSLTLKQRFSDLFRLDTDIDRPGTVAAIRESVAFQGTNVWSLVFAIFVASIGLNLNSPAVIIGAMLISPLLGPITGAGLALAIYDIPLLRRALANLALMTGVSLAASTLYFWLSPLNTITSEILSRTTPTFYDVLIASLGGGALMVSLSRKNRSSNILAGVAIATALMPPLCSAGYGLANHDLAVFAGAFYLYLINSVFLGLVTYIFSKALHLRTPSTGEQADRKVDRRRHVWLTGLAVLVFITPSVFVAYDVVKQSSWRANLTHFEEANLTFPNTQVLSTKITGTDPERTLEIALVGAPLSADLQAHLKQLLPQYHLSGLKLKFVQNGLTDVDMTTEKVKPAAAAAALVPEVTREVLVLFPALANIAWGDMTGQDPGQAAPSVLPTAFARWSTEVPDTEHERLAAFLRLRLNLAQLHVVHEVLPKSP